MAPYWAATTGHANTASAGQGTTTSPRSLGRLRPCREAHRVDEDGISEPTDRIELIDEEGQRDVFTIGLPSPQ